MNRTLCLLSLMASLWALPVTAQEVPAVSVVTYDQVRAVFKKHCVTCHNSRQPRGDLDLSSMGSIKSGAGSGQVAIAAKPDESLIYTMAAHLEEPHMPPNSSKIPQRELDLIRGWIEGGLLERQGGTDQTPVPVAKAALKAPLIAEVTPGRRKTAATALAISPTAPLVALSGQQQVVLFSLDDFQPQRAFPFPEGEVFVTKFSPDGKLLLVAGGLGSDSGLVVGIEVATGKRLFEVAEENDVVLAADLSPDQRLVAIGGPGRTIKIVQTTDGKPVATINKHTDWILSLAFSPDGLLLASADRFGGVMVWEAATGKEFFNLRGHVGPVPDLGWATDGNRLLSAGQDGTLRWWNMHRGEQLAEWSAHQKGATRLILGSHANLLSGGRDNRLVAWTEAGQKQWELPVNDEVVELASTVDGQRVVVADASGQTVVISLPDLKVLGNLEIPVNAALARESTTVSRAAQVAAQHKSRRSQPKVISRSDPHLDELTETRQALEAAETSAQSIEDSLARARVSVEHLKKLLARQEAAARGKASPVPSR